MPEEAFVGLRRNSTSAKQIEDTIQREVVCAPHVWAHSTRNLDPLQKWNIKRFMRINVWNRALNDTVHVEVRTYKYDEYEYQLHNEMPKLKKNKKTKLKAMKTSVRER